MAGALLIASNYILGLIRGSNSIYLFDLHNNENVNSSNSGIAVFLIFNTSYSLENYIQSVYYNMLTH